MRKILLFCILLSLSLNSIAVFANSEREIWYWAWRSYDLDVEESEDQRGDLLAFTPDGEVNVLLEDIAYGFVQRIDDTTAFVSYEVDEAFHLYYVDSQSAQFITEISHLIRNHAPFIRVDETTYLIVDKSIDLYLLYDFNQHSSRELTLQGWCEPDCIRISEDGRYIRYLVQDNYGNPRILQPSFTLLPYQIYEYDLHTDTKRLIYEQQLIQVDGFDPSLGGCTPDQFGEHWYCELFINDNRNYTRLADEKFILSLDGSIETVPIEWILRVQNKRWYFLDIDRNERESSCVDCPITVYPDGDETQSFQFALPNQDTSDVSSRFDNLNFLDWHMWVRFYSEDYLAYYGNSTTILARSGETYDIGNYFCCATPKFDQVNDEIGIRITVFGQHQAQEGLPVQVWNTRTMELMGAFPSGVYPRVGYNGATFRDYSIFLEQSQNDYGYGLGPVYSYLDEVWYTIELEDEAEGYFTAGSYIDAFSSGVLLTGYGEFSREERNALSYPDDAIYRWTPTDGATQLIEDAIALKRWNGLF